VIVVLELLRLVIDITMWLVLSRMVLRLVVRRAENPFWQAVCLGTEPVYRVVRLATAGRVGGGWIGLLTLVALGLVRVPVAWLLRAGAGA
jgi:uncharacterized protein YggT (Ycf19 family)